MPADLDLVVRNGTIVSGRGRRVADVGIRGSRFAQIARPGELAGGQEELDATGLYVLPGLIDGHVHFREPGLEHEEDWLTGSRGAAMGGITTVLDMPNTVPPTATAAEAARKAALAREKSYVDFGLFGLLGRDNVGREDVGELAAVAAAPAVVGLKVFLGPTTGGLDAPADDQLRAGLAIVRDAGLRVAFHAEDAAVIESAEVRLRASGRSDARAHLESRPVEAEVVAIDRAGRLLADTKAKGHILHVSSRAGLAAVESWRRRGVDLTCEVTAHHCFLSADDYGRLGGLLKCNPPVRERVEGQGLLVGLAEGRIDCIGSDHAPHVPAAKSAADVWSVPAGIAGVETALRLFLTHGVDAGRLTVERLVSAFAERPARAWGLWPRKGTIRIGSDADLTIVDPERAGVIRGAELHARHGLTPFEGRATRGAPVSTIVRGRVVTRDSGLVGAPGWGEPVSRS